MVNGCTSAEQNQSELVALGHALVWRVVMIDVHIRKFRVQPVDLHHRRGLVASIAAANMVLFRSRATLSPSTWRRPTDGDVWTHCYHDLVSDFGVFIKLHHLISQTPATGRTPDQGYRVAPLRDHHRPDSANDPAHARPLYSCAVPSQRRSEARNVELGQ